MHHHPVASYAAPPPPLDDSFMTSCGSKSAGSLLRPVQQSLVRRGPRTRSTSSRRVRSALLRCWIVVVAVGPPLASLASLCPTLLFLSVCCRFPLPLPRAFVHLAGGVGAVIPVLYNSDPVPLGHLSYLSADWSAVAFQNLLDQGQVPVCVVCFVVLFVAPVRPLLALACVVPTHLSCLPVCCLCGSLAEVDQRLLR